jgi:hypothetical protein
MSVPAKHFYLEIKIKNKNSNLSDQAHVSFPSDNIEYLTIKENVLSILPRLEMVVYDSGDLIESIPIVDKDIISITLSSTKEEEGITLDFIISSFISHASPEDNQYNKIKIIGYLYVENMFVPHRTRSFSGNSEDVLKRISKESKVDFNNIHNVKSSDKMIWYQDSNNFNFINHILKRSYVDKDTIFFYGNVDNNFIYTSLNKEIDKENTFIARYDRGRTENFVMADDENDILYYDSYDLLNLTEIYNNISNYGMRYCYYDLNGNMKNETITSIKKITDLLNKSKDYDGKDCIQSNMGMMSNPNVFKDYFKAINQNIFYKNNLFSVSMTMNINSSTKVKLFDKINVALPSTFFRGGEINDVYSGVYLVTAITYNVTSGNQLQKQIMLSRYGINKAGTIKHFDIN